MSACVAIPIRAGVVPPAATAFKSPFSNRCKRVGRLPLRCCWCEGLDSIKDKCRPKRTYGCSDHRQPSVITRRNSARQGGAKSSESWSVTFSTTQRWLPCRSLNSKTAKGLTGVAVEQTEAVANAQSFDCSVVDLHGRVLA